MLTPEEKKQKQRTLAQNRALHKFCAEVANNCLQKGITLKAIIDVVQETGVYPEPETIKDLFFRNYAKQLFGKSHTSDLTVIELSKVIDHAVKALALCGCLKDFPSQENAYYENLIIQQ